MHTGASFYGVGFFWVLKICLQQMLPVPNVKRALFMCGQQYDSGCCAPIHSRHLFMHRKLCCMKGSKAKCKKSYTAVK